MSEELMKGPKKLIVVPESVLQELMNIAKRTGLTISELASLMLAHAARMLRGRDNITSVFRDSVLIADTKRLGAVMVPSEALLVLLENSNDDTRARFLSLVRDFVKTATIYLKAHGIEDLEPRDVVALFAPTTTIDVIDGIDGEKRLIISLGPHNSSEALLSYVGEVAETAVREMGYTITAKERIGSIVVIEYRKNQQYEKT